MVIFGHAGEAFIVAEEGISGRPRCRADSLSGSAHIRVSSKLFLTADILGDIHYILNNAPNRRPAAIFDLIFYEIICTSARKVIVIKPLFLFMPIFALNRIKSR